MGDGETIPTATPQENQVRYIDISEGAEVLEAMAGEVATLLEDEGVRQRCGRFLALARTKMDEARLLLLEAQRLDRI